MCRYDDDYDWYVDSTIADHVDATAAKCEDCGRTVPAGEPHTLYVARDEGEDEADGKYVWAAQDPVKARPYHYGNTSGHYIDESKPFLIITEDKSDVYEALGFIVSDDVENPAWEPKIHYHHQCAQCFIANAWLEDICNQTTVLVTATDISSHTAEYTSHQLGADFMRLDRWVRFAWAGSRGGAVVSPRIVELTTERAIAHAKVTGLDGAH